MHYKIYVTLKYFLINLFLQIIYANVKPSGMGHYQYCYRHKFGHSVLFAINHLGRVPPDLVTNI